MSPGDHVLYAPDPLAYGVMEVVGVRRDGRLECELLTTGDIEIFDAHELALEAHEFDLDLREAA